MGGGSGPRRAAVYQIYGWTRLETVAGWIGVPLAALSVYGGLALLLDDGVQHTACWPGGDTAGSGGRPAAGGCASTALMSRRPNPAGR